MEYIDPRNRITTSAVNLGIDPSSIHIHLRDKTPQEPMKWIQEIGRVSWATFIDGESWVYITLSSYVGLDERAGTVHFDPL